MPSKNKSKLNEKVLNRTGDRLREWRKQIPLKSYQLAKVIGISQGSLSEIETNKSLPSAGTLALLHQRTTLDIVWLLTAEGDMVRCRLSKEEKFYIPFMDPQMRKFVKLCTEIFNKASPENKAFIQGFLEGKL